MKLFHLSSGSMGDWHFKAGRDDRDWPADKAATLIATGASRAAASEPPAPTPAPSGRELRHAVARAMEQERRSDRAAGAEDLGIADDDRDDITLTTENAAALVPGGGAAEKPVNGNVVPTADKSKGPRAKKG